MRKGRPLEIFLFKGECGAPLCRKSYNILSNHLNTASEVLANEVPNLGGSEINVVITGRTPMKAMNSQFRGKDTATDVLSFPLDEKPIGEIWLCPAVINENAKFYDQPLKHELLRVLIHGILHLAGFDHQGSFREDDGTKEKMYEIQEKILSHVLDS